MACGKTHREPELTPELQQRFEAIAGPCKARTDRGLECGPLGKQITLIRFGDSDRLRRVAVTGLAADRAEAVTTMATALAPLLSAQQVEAIRKSAMDPGLEAGRQLTVRADGVFLLSLYDPDVVSPQPAADQAISDELRKRGHDTNKPSLQSRVVFRLELVYDEA